MFCPGISPTFFLRNILTLALTDMLLLGKIPAGDLHEHIPSTRHPIMPPATPAPPQPPSDYDGGTCTPFPQIFEAPETGKMYRQYDGCFLKD
jgi:hypothetical protein